MHFHFALRWLLSVVGRGDASVGRTDAGKITTVLHTYEPLKKDFRF